MKGNQHFSRTVVEKCARSRRYINYTKKIAYFNNKIFKFLWTQNNISFQNVCANIFGIFYCSLWLTMQVGKNKRICNTNCNWYRKWCCYSQWNSQRNCYNYAVWVLRGFKLFSSIISISKLLYSSCTLLAFLAFLLM